MCRVQAVGEVATQRQALDVSRTSHHSSLYYCRPPAPSHPASRRLFLGPLSTPTTLATTTTRASHLHHRTSSPRRVASTAPLSPHVTELVPAPTASSTASADSSSTTITSAAALSFTAWIASPTFRRLLSLIVVSPAPCNAAPGAPPPGRAHVDALHVVPPAPQSPTHAANTLHTPPRSTQCRRAHSSFPQQPRIHGKGNHDRHLFRPWRCGNMPHHRRYCLLLQIHANRPHLPRPDNAAG